jgi:HD-like signal output (HDOD) protein
LDQPGRAGSEAIKQEEDKWWAPRGEAVTEPVAAQRPDLSPEARALENVLISHFDGHDLTLPPLVQIAERVLPRLRDPNCSLTVVARDLAEDQVIAAAVLRMVNSPLYRGVNKITALQPAVSRLGTRALRTLLIHESLRAAMLSRKGRSSDFAKIIWRASLASGCIMRGLSEFTTAEKENAFLIGLLHDIGNVVVLRVVDREQASGRYEIDLDTFDYLCQECHQEFGELVAAAWGLPAELKALITDHHTYPAADDPLRMPRLQLMLTDMANALLGYTPFVPYDLLESRPARELGLAERNEFVQFLAHLPDQVEDAVGAF